MSFYGPCGYRTFPYFQRFEGRYPFDILEIGADRDTATLATCQVVKHPQYRMIVLPDAYHSFDEPELVNVAVSSNGNATHHSRQATEKAKEILLAHLAANLRDGR